MLKTILSITGKPGLFKIITNGKNMLLVEDIISGKRYPAHARDRIVSLGEFAKVLPDFDRDRVYDNDIRKFFSWYNLLLQAGFTAFKDPEPADAPAE